MVRHRSNIVLIGMPGSGKSTVGVILAKQLSLDFVDTDLLIQSSQKRPLQEIVDNDGYLALRSIEQQVLLSLECRGTVVATGGSAAYSAPAMEHLKRDGIAVFLHADLDTLHRRVRDFSTRGLAKRPEQTLEELFQERFTLYRNYADITVDCRCINHEDVAAGIIRELELYHSSTGYEP